MGSHHEEPPVELEGVPEEENISAAEAADELEESPDEQENYTTRHPGHHGEPPHSEREAREDS
jgi:hypothetical protein